MEEVGLELSLWLSLKLLLVPAVGLLLFCLCLLDGAHHRPHRPTPEGGAGAVAAAAAVGRALSQPLAASEDEPGVLHDSHRQPLPLHRLLHQRAVDLASRMRHHLTTLLRIAPAPAEDAMETTTRKRSVSSTSSSSSSSSFSSTSPSCSPSSSPYPSVDPLRVNLHSDGVAHCYRVVPTLSLSDVVSFYLQRCTAQDKHDADQPRTSPPPKAADANASKRGGGAARQGLVVPSSVTGLGVSSVVVRYQGRKLPLGDSLERLGIPDMAVLGQSALNGGVVMGSDGGCWCVGV